MMPHARPADRLRRALRRGGLTGRRAVALAACGGIALALLIVPAAADPISIGFFLFSGPLGGIFSFSALVTASQVGLYALSAAVVAGAQLIGRNQKANPSDYKSTFQTSESSEVNAIGRVRLGGLVAFANTRLSDRYRLIWHAKGLLSAIELYFLGGREVCVEDNNNVSTPPYYLPDYDASFVTVETKVGDGNETAYSALMAAFPLLWTSEHRCRGIAQSLVKYISPGLYTPEFGILYSSGEPPLEIVARMNTAYDPRDGGQHVDNESTWKWSDNGILCAARIMLSYPDLTVASFDWDFLATEATRADTLVATKTGTAPRSRCSGIWLSEAKRGDTMQDVLDSIGAEIVTTDEGLIRIRLIDDTPVSEVDLPALHQLDFAWKSGPEAVERPNLCTVKYYSPEANYEMAEIDMTGIGWARIDDEVERYGEKKFEVELPFCPDASQAQRIARRLFLLARADTGQVVMNFVGLAAWGTTYARVEDADDDVMMLSKIAPPRIDDEQASVSIPFVVWPSLPEWNPSSDEAAAPTQVLDIQFESGLAKPLAPSAASIVQYDGGAYEARQRSSIVASAVTNPKAINAVMRTFTDGLPDEFRRMTAYMADEGIDPIYNGVDGDPTVYAYKAVSGPVSRADFKVQFFAEPADPSYYSELLTIEPLAIDNSAPPAPSLDVDAENDGGTWEFVATASTTAMNVARLDILKETTPGSGVYSVIETGPGRPEQDVVAEFNVASPGGPTVAIRLRAIAYSSNGTASAVTQVSRNIS